MATREMCAFVDACHMHTNNVGACNDVNVNQFIGTLTFLDQAHKVHVLSLSLSLTQMQMIAAWRQLSSLSSLLIHLVDLFTH